MRKSHSPRVKVTRHSFLLALILFHPPKLSETGMCRWPHFGSDAAYRPENSSGLKTYSSVWLLLPQAWWMKRESEREVKRSRKKHDVDSPHSQHECLMTSCSPLQTSHSSTHSACAASGQPLSFANTHRWHKMPTKDVILYRSQMYKEDDLCSINNRWCTYCSCDVILYLACKVHRCNTQIHRQHAVDCHRGWLQASGEIILLVLNHYTSSWTWESMSQMWCYLTFIHYQYFWISKAFTY